jgi:hypothetical protein
MMLLCAISLHALSVFFSQTKPRVRRKTERLLNVPFTYVTPQSLQQRAQYGVGNNASDAQPANAKMMNQAMVQQTQASVQQSQGFSNGQMQIMYMHPQTSPYIYHQGVLPAGVVTNPVRHRPCMYVRVWLYTHFLHAMVRLVASSRRGTQT